MWTDDTRRGAVYQQFLANFGVKLTGPALELIVAEWKRSGCAPEYIEPVFNSVADNHLQLKEYVTQKLRSYNQRRIR